MPEHRPHAHPDTPLGSAISLRLHEAQLRWLRLEAAEAEYSVSEAARAAIWSAILRDPQAEATVGRDVLLQLVDDEDRHSFPATRHLEGVRE